MIIKMSLRRLKAEAQRLNTRGIIIISIHHDHMILAIYLTREVEA